MCQFYLLSRQCDGGLVYNIIIVKQVIVGKHGDKRSADAIIKKGNTFI